MNIDSKICQSVALKYKELSQSQIQSVLELKEEGFKAPFIAFYKVDKTGLSHLSLIESIFSEHEDWKRLEKKKVSLLKFLEKKEGVSETFRKEVQETSSLEVFEKLSEPYQKKKGGKVYKAQEAGLKPLADWIWAVAHGEIKEDKTPEVKSKEFQNAKKGYVTYDEILKGVQHILIDRLFQDSELRRKVEDEILEKGILICEAGDKMKKNSRFQIFVGQKEPFKKFFTPRFFSRYLALRKGWREKQLKISIKWDEASLYKFFQKQFISAEVSSALNTFLSFCAKSTLNLHMAPSIIQDLHRQLQEKAENQALEAFRYQAQRTVQTVGLGSQVVLCAFAKDSQMENIFLVLVDKKGELISHTQMSFKEESEAQTLEIQKFLQDLWKQISVGAVVVRRSHQGRKLQSLLKKHLKALNLNSPVVWIRDHRALAWARSEEAQKETLDDSVLAALALVRELQNPLEQLSRIHPKFLGLGAQDVDENRLEEVYHKVLTSEVCYQGVDLNRAPLSLLCRVSGLDRDVAEQILLFRKKQKFQSKGDLLKVVGLSDRAFEEAAGFLRVFGGESVLDESFVHPTHYQALQDMAKDLGVKLTEIKGQAAKLTAPKKEKWVELLGAFTFSQVIKALDFKAPEVSFLDFEEEIQSIGDIKEGGSYSGQICQLTSFGAFVDLGLEKNGFIHISELSSQFVKNPLKYLSIGNWIKVKVLGVDKEKNQIRLSLKNKEFSRPKTSFKKPLKPDGKRRPSQRAFKAKDRKNQSSQRPPQRKLKKPQKAFNNPFEVLANLNIKK